MLSQFHRLPSTSLYMHTAKGVFITGDAIMFAKISIALAIVLAVASGAGAVEKRQPGAANARVGAPPVFVNRCVHGVWDANGARCDGADN